MATRPHPLAASAGFSIAASLLGASLIPAGGLAPALVAAGLGLAVATPLAVATWQRRDRAPDPTTEATVDAAGLVLLSVVLGPTMTSSPSMVLAGAGLWLATYVLADQALLLGGALWTVGLAGAAFLGLTQPVDTALVPIPASIGATLPLAVLLGTLLPGLGVTGWSTRVERVPGDRGTPWVSAGIGLLALLATLLVSAARYGASFGDEAALPGALVLAFVAPGLLSWLHGGGPASRARLLSGLVGSSWVATMIHKGAQELPDLAATSVLPLLIAGVLGRRALALDGLPRLGASALALVLVGTAALSFRLPETIPGAIGLGGLAVGSFWVVMGRSRPRAGEVMG